MMKMSLAMPMMHRACLVVVLSVCTALAAGPEEEITVLRIAAEAHRAVVRFADGGMKVVQPGDRIKPYGEIASISKNRIVLKNKSKETIIIHYANGKQSIQRSRKMNPTTQRPQIQTSENSEFRSDGMGVAREEINTGTSKK